MREGQVLLASLLLLSLLILYSALPLQEALSALGETWVLQRGLQARLSAASGLTLAEALLKEGSVPSAPVVLNTGKGETLSLTFTPDLAHSTVRVEATAQVMGRRFVRKETFSFPFFFGSFALAVWNVDPKSGTPRPPTLFPFYGIRFGASVFVWEGRREEIPKDLRVERNSLFGVGEDGTILLPDQPLSFGIVTFEVWRRVPPLPGPFLLSVPFVPLVPGKEIVTDGEVLYRRITTLPRFPRQYSLDEEKGLFYFSEHEAGRFVLLRYWHFGVGLFGTLYANASIRFGEGTNVMAKGKIMVTGKVQGKIWEVTTAGIFPFPKGRVLEGIAPLPCPPPPFAAWRMKGDPSLGGAGRLLPQGSLLDIGKEKGDFFFLSGGGEVQGFIPRGRGMVSVICDGTMSLLGSVGAEEGSTLVLVARQFHWKLKEGEPVQILSAFLWATDGSLTISPPPSSPSPIRCLLVGSFNLNEPPQWADPSFRFGVEVYGAKVPFLSPLVQIIQEGGDF